MATSPLTKLKLLLFPFPAPSVSASCVRRENDTRGQGARRASEFAGRSRLKRGFLDEGNWRKESHGVPPRNADECGALGRRKLVGAIALTDHSAVARFDFRGRTSGRPQSSSARFGKNDFQLACGRSGPLYYLHLRPLRAGETVRECTFREKQGQNVLITYSWFRSQAGARASLWSPLTL